MTFSEILPDARAEGLLIWIALWFLWRKGLLSFCAGYRHAVSSDELLNSYIPLSCTSTTGTADPALHNGRAFAA